MLTVYVKTTSFCGQCKATETMLDRAGIVYEIVSLEDTAAEVVEDFKATVGTLTPIVVTPTTAWSGFRPALVADLIAA